MSRKFRPPVRALVGTDFAEYCRRVGQALDDENEARLGRARVEAEKTQYEGNKTYYLLVRGKAPGPIHVETISELPLVGKLSATGRNYNVAVTNLRLAYVDQLQKRKLIPDRSQALEYCAGVTFLTSVGDL